MSNYQIEKLNHKIKQQTEEILILRRAIAEEVEAKYQAYKRIAELTARLESNQPALIPAQQPVLDKSY
jgi:septal ring factor EnvC (AmiA/AmiB activator)